MKRSHMAHAFTYHVGPDVTGDLFVGESPSHEEQMGREWDANDPLFRDIQSPNSAIGRNGADQAEKISVERASQEPSQ